MFWRCSEAVSRVFRRVVQAYSISVLMMFRYHILVTGTTGGACEKFPRVQNFPDSMQKQYLGFKNPALVEDITNIKYGCSVGILGYIRVSKSLQESNDI